ncbi:MAG: T9SS type A sorting domain-containing protein [Bacteroidia bacterium]
MKNLLALCFLLFAVTGIQAQSIVFEAMFPEIDNKPGASISQTADGGYIIGTNYQNLTIAGKGICPIITRTDSFGNELWEKKLNFEFHLASMFQTPDGGYIASGMTHTASGSLAGALMKLNAAGDPVWTRNFISLQLSGSPLSSETLTRTSDGGFVLAGFNTNGVYLLKTDSIGDSLWAKTSINSAIRSTYSIATTLDSGFIVTGCAAGQVLLTKTTSNGDSAWMKSYGNINYNQTGLSVKQTSDGGYIIAGHSNAPNASYYIIKTNANGDTLWTSMPSNTNYALSNMHICQTKDNGYILFGDHYPGVRLIRLKSTGAVLWVRNYGLGAESYLGCGTMARDNGFAASGYTRNNAGTSGTYLLKTDTSGFSNNIIMGTLYFDKNKNCVQDTGEAGLLSRQVVLTPGGIITNTDSLGNYSFLVPSGTYTVTLPAAPYYNLSCPGTNAYTVNFPALGDSSKNHNFADTVLASCPDLTMNIGTCGLGACFRNTYYCNYGNQGTLADSNVIIVLQADPNVIFVSSSIPWTVLAPNTYSFNVGILAPGQSGSLSVVDSVSCAAPMGVSICLTGRISAPAAECDTTNNSSTDCHTVSASMDPNERQVASQQFSTKGYVTQETILPSDKLEYLIKFQNTGNAAAVNITVTDSLSSLLDLSTLQPSVSSAPFTYSVGSNGLVKWHFSNIMLPDSNTNKAGSTGFIRYTINQKAGNPGGSVIQCRSSIVFDLNKPVLTNATVNTILLVTGMKDAGSQNLSGSRIYPNPSNGSASLEINIQSLKSGSEIRFSIYDAMGKEISSSLIPSGTTPAGSTGTITYPLEYGDLAVGMYYYTVRNGDQDLGRGKMMIR